MGRTFVKPLSENTRVTIRNEEQAYSYVEKIDLRKNKEIKKIKKE
jgi:hypothetical protein